LHCKNVSQTIEKQDAAVQGVWRIVAATLNGAPQDPIVAMAGDDSPADRVMLEVYADGSLATKEYLGTDLLNTDNGVWRAAGGAGAILCPGEPPIDITYTITASWWTLDILSAKGHERSEV
jgi:hypothetical protein